jgi:hypothetical protein
MKIRNGFVSNSSSSSFYIMGIYINDINDVINKRKVFESFAKDKWQQKEVNEFLAAKEVTLETVSDELIEEYLDEFSNYEMLESLVSLDFHDVDGEIYIGLSPDEMKEDETLKQFKDRVSNLLESNGINSKNFNLDWYSACWYDG